MAQVFRERGWGVTMNNVRIKKEELLKTLRANLQQHIADYQESIKGYQQMAVNAIHAKHKELTENPLAKLDFSDLEVPRSYEKAYKQVIRMLEMETRDEIDLNADQFGCFVMDDWSWKEEFAMSNSKYAFAAARRP